MDHNIDQVLKDELDKTRAEIKRLEDRAASISQLLGDAAPATTPPQGVLVSEEWEPMILAWFAEHPEGRHKLAEVRAALGAPLDGPGAKGFKVALHRAIDRKVVKSTGLRGKGAAYWAGPGLAKALNVAPKAKTG